MSISKLIPNRLYSTSGNRRWLSSDILFNNRQPVSMCFQGIIHDIANIIEIIYCIKQNAKTFEWETTV